MTSHFDGGPLPFKIDPPFNDDFHGFSHSNFLFLEDFPLPSIDHCHVAIVLWHFIGIGQCSMNGTGFHCWSYLEPWCFGKVCECYTPRPVSKEARHHAHLLGHVFFDFAHHCSFWGISFRGHLRTCSMLFWTSFWYASSVRTIHQVWGNIFHLP